MGLNTVKHQYRKSPVVLHGVGLLAVALMMALALGACGGEPGYVSISAGNGHTCGIREDGAVDCWGFDEYGQATPPEGEFLSVSAGSRHTCGVRKDGSVVCWGWGLDFSGETMPTEGEFASVSAGEFHTCAVREGGAVACWGWGLDFNGETMPTGGGFTSVSAGACAVREGGQSPAGV